jgi:hypothetical protein
MGEVREMGELERRVKKLEMKEKELGVGIEQRKRGVRGSGEESAEDGKEHGNEGEGKEEEKFDN